MKEHINMGKNMVKENILGQMEVFIMEIGKIMK